MDILHYVFDSIIVRDCSLGTFELQRPWGFHRSAMQSDMAVIFNPVNGHCILSMPDGRTEKLMPGDLGLVLHGSFEFKSEGCTSPVPFLSSWGEQRLQPLGQEIMRSGPEVFRWPLRPSAPAHGTGMDDELLAVGLLLEDVARSPVLAMLPQLIVLKRAQQDDMDWFGVLHRFMVAESGAKMPGYNAAARQMARMLFVYVMRRYVTLAGSTRTGWMRGMGDPAIGKVLARMHFNFVEPWTLSSLAAECGVSRTVLAQRFRVLMGRTPMDYLAAVRMQVAANRLRLGETVSETCEAVGYASVAAFRRAFRRHWGLGPTEYLSQATAPAVASAR
jgi:AraC-like DNA-binding protein